MRNAHKNFLTQGKAYFFKKFFILLTILEWNKVDFNIRNLETLSVF